MGSAWSDEPSSLKALEDLFDDHFEVLKPISHRLFERFVVRPYGVLGLAPAPGGAVDAVVVDPSNSQVIGLDKPCKAEGESQAIYAWLGIGGKSGRFPSAVQRQFSRNLNNWQCVARYHRYGVGQHVIHAACPALHDLDQSINDLTEAYAAIFVEFCRALGSSEPSNNKVWTNSTSSAA
ncbi:unnamed protein product, partial [Polarella glacialis]